jgi:hypothetical protein
MGPMPEKATLDIHSRMGLGPRSRLDTGSEHRCDTTEETKQGRAIGPIPDAIVFAGLTRDSSIAIQGRSPAQGPIPFRVIWPGFALNIDLLRRWFSGCRSPLLWGIPSQAGVSPRLLRSRVGYDFEVP